MEDEQPTTTKGRPAVRNSHKVWVALVLCFLVLTSSRIVVGAFTAPEGSGERYIFGLLSGCLVGLFIVVLMISPFYVSSNRRVKTIVKTDPDAIIVRLAGLAGDTNEALSELEFPTFRKPQFVFVTLAVSREGLTVLRGFGKRAAFFHADSITNIHLEERVIATGVRYPVFSFYVESYSDSDQSVRLSFPMFNDKRFLFGKVSERQRREKLDSMEAALGIMPSAGR